MKIEPTYVTDKQKFILKDKGIEEVNGLSIGIQQWEIIEWLRILHGIWIYSYPVHPFNSDENNDYPKTVWVSKIISTNYRFEEKFINVDNGLAINHYNTPQKAYSAAFDYILNTII